MFVSTSDETFDASDGFDTVECLYSVIYMYK